MSTVSKGCGFLALIAAILVVGAVAYLFNNLTGHSGRDSTGSSNAGVDKTKGNGDRAGAQAVCEKFVKEKLKTTGTVTFSGEHTTQVHGRVWRDSGAVNNSSGTLVRQSFVCRVQYVNSTVGADNYKLLALTGIG